MKKALLLFTLSLVLITSLTLSLAAEVNYPSYTYDYWQRPLPSVIPYKVARVVLGTSITTTLPTDTQAQFLRSVEDLFVTDERYYFVDHAAKRVVIVDKDFQVEQIIHQIEYAKNELDEPLYYTLEKPRGIYVTEEAIYITDENDLRNGYIYVLNHDYEFVARYGRPDHPTYNSDVFKPNKIVVDKAGRMYIVVIGAFEGIVELQRDGQFSRFIGVQPVQVSPIDLLWRQFMSREQLERTRLFLPVEYNAISLDHEGFLYATSSGSEVSPIQRINPKGSDVLRKNGYIRPIGDIVRMPDQNRSGLTSIDVNSYGMYSVIDRVNKKIFTYNDEGYLNYVTGFEGEFEGNFLFPTAIRYDGENMVVSDTTSQRTVITIFEPTEFGSLVNQANQLTYEGESIDAADIWQQVLNMNQNYSLAHVGIGHAYYRDRNFEEAMQSYELGQDRIHYSQAYREYRKIQFEQNFPLIGFGVMAVIVLAIAAPVVKDIIRKEADR